VVVLLATTFNSPSALMVVSEVELMATFCAVSLILPCEASMVTCLVSEIVELTRIEGDPLAQKTEVVRIGEIINETVSDCRLEAEVRGCSIQLQGQLPGEVSGDPELLRRAMENVLRNAIRYSPQDEVINVALTQTAKAATITIRDCGPGVPPEALPEIFKPFFRVEESRDAESGGMGLGLSIAKRAVQMHQGEITAQNAGPGLCVQILIPLIDGIDFISST